MQVPSVCKDNGILTWHCFILLLRLFLLSLVLFDLQVINLQIINPSKEIRQKLTGSLSFIIGKLRITITLLYKSPVTF